VGRGKRNRPSGRWIASITIWSFILAVVIGIAARLLLNAIYSLLLSFFILIAVIMLGIIFDIIGTAAAAAELPPLNARAARKVDGARYAVYLVQHADQVANFCNDVIGDISGIVSGTLAAVIISRLAAASFFEAETVEVYGGILLAAMVAALTVGGKAWGKNVAITRSTEIIAFVGKILARVDRMGKGSLFLKKSR
jgi:CBS domain containing-hemolysin-like protein